MSLWHAFSSHYLCIFISHITPFDTRRRTVMARSQNKQALSFGKTGKVGKELTISTCSLRWRHNERDGVSNNQPHDCLLNHLFRRRSKKTSKLRITGLCEGNSPVTGDGENVSIWWCHHVTEREIKFIGIFEDRGHRGPYSPYKPLNHNLYIGIIIFPHIDNSQSTGYN